MKSVFVIILLGTFTIARSQIPWVDMNGNHMEDLCPNYKALEPEFQQKANECNSTMAVISNPADVLNICSYTDGLKTCISNVLKVIGKCKGDEMKELVRHAYKLLDSTTDFLCKDKGRRFKSIVEDPNTIQCITSLSQETMQTADSCKKLQQFEKYIDDSTLKTCSYLSDSAACLSEGLEDCPSDNVKTYFKDAINIPLDALDCAYDSSALGLAASPAYILSAVLLAHLFTLI